MFSESKQALLDLRKTLRCRQCHANSNDLLCLGQCEHWFCRSCAESKSGHPCPICSVPSVARDTRVNIQLSNVASLCSYMMQLMDGGNTLCGRIGSESISSSMDCGNVETNGYDSNEEVRQCTLPLSNSVKETPKTGVEMTTCINSCGKGNGDNDFKTSNSNREDETSKEKFVTDKSYEDTPHPPKLIQFASGSTGKKIMSSKVGTRVPYTKGCINELSKCGEPLGETSIKERSNKPRKSVAKILDAMNEITPESKKRKCDDMKETPESVGVVRVQRSKVKSTESAGSKKSTPNKKSTPRSAGKGNSSKISSAVSDLTPTKTTPHSSRKRQSVEEKNLCKKNAKGETPLQVATIKMDIGEVRRLLDAGANPNVKDNAGWTPLHEAIGQGCTDIASLLITNGASVNAPGLDNETPLHDAVINQNMECVRLLLVNGASVHARNVHGIAPIDMAKTDEIKSLLMNASRDSAIADVDLPMLDESAKPLCFTGSDLTKTQSRTLIQYSRVLQGKIVDEVTPEVTQLITNVNEIGACSRTMKYLSALLTGKSIVNLNWLEECAKAKGRVPEQEFEVHGCQSHPNSSAPKKALENRLKQLPPLFDGCQIFFYGKFDSSGLSKEELTALVKLGGGVVLKREPHLHNLDDYPYTRPFHSQSTVSLADCTIYKIYDDTCCNPPSVQAQRMACLPVSWFLDSIATFSFLEKTSYMKL